MDELLEDFKLETKDLTQDLIEILEEIEGDFSLVKRLEEYGQVVDRIMGGAKSIAIALDDSTYMDNIGNYAEVCKAVGYKGSQIEENEHFYNIVVALLLDATEMLMEFLENLGTDKEKDIKAILNKTFLERLKWVSSQFDKNTRSSVAIAGGKASQGQIDDLLKNFGL